MDGLCRYLFILLLLASHFSHAQPMVNWDEEAALLAYHQRIWDAHDIDHYRMVMDMGCFGCAWYFPAEIVVEAGEVVAVLDPESGASIREQRGSRQGERILEVRPEYFRTIPELFGVIGKAIDNHEGTTHPGSKASGLHVEYDDRLGFPGMISVDYRKVITEDGYELSATDGQAIYRIMEFTSTD